MTTASDRFKKRTLGLSLGLLLFAGVVHADTTEDQKKTARNAMAEGRELRDEKNYKDALESFKKAHAIMAVPTTGIEVARTLVLLNQLVEAREVAGDVAKLPPVPKEPPPFQAARDEAKKLAEDLAKRIPTVQIVLQGAEKGPSEVRIDEAPISAEAMKSPIAKNPGKHAVTVKRGSDLKSADIELREGDAQTVTLDFRPPKADAPPPPPPPPPPPSAPEQSAWKRPMVIGGFAVAGVGVIAGSITGLLAISKASSAKKQCVDKECPPETHADIDSGKTMATISTISFAVGVVGAGFGVVGLLTAPKSGDSAPDAAKAHITPFIGIGNVGVAGRF